MHTYARYIQNENALQCLPPVVTSLYVSTLLQAFPPSTIITAEFDPLADDGELFARRLRAAGVPATNTLYRNVVMKVPKLLIDNYRNYSSIFR